MADGDMDAAGALASSTTRIFSFVRGKVADRILPEVGPSEGFAQPLSKAKRRTDTTFFIPIPMKESPTRRNSIRMFHGNKFEAEN
jgi:hypothetical protein